MEVSAKLKNLEPIFLLITMVAVVESPAFFIIGISYCIGLDAGYGVTTATPTIEESALVGFFVSFKVLCDVISVILSGILSKWVLIPSTIIITIAVILAVRFVLKLSSNKNKQEDRFEELLNKLSLTSYSLSIALFLVSFLCLFPISAFTAGKAHAVEVISQISKDGCTRSFQDNSI
ncbi:hypothetical protein [Pseudoalteromonas pernae]|uniref:hypothetical protein n=1 Tax=Pseudoalteromonas pernae TaxID=3118054 RepID=UPI003241E135